MSNVEELLFAPVDAPTTDRSVALDEIAGDVAATVSRIVIAQGADPLTVDLDELRAGVCQYVAGDMLLTLRRTARDVQTMIEALERGDVSDVRVLATSGRGSTRLSMSWGTADDESADSSAYVRIALRLKSSTGAIGRALARVAPAALPRKAQNEPEVTVSQASVNA